MRITKTQPISYTIIVVATHDLNQHGNDLPFNYIQATAADLEQAGYVNRDGVTRRLKQHVNAILEGTGQAADVLDELITFVDFVVGHDFDDSERMIRRFASLGGWVDQTDGNLTVDQAIKLAEELGFNVDR